MIRELFVSVLWNFKYQATVQPWRCQNVSLTPHLTSPTTFDCMFCLTTKKISTHRIVGPCGGVHGDRVPSQRVSNAEIVFISWRHNPRFGAVLHLLRSPSTHGNIIRVTGPLCGEFTDDRWIPQTKAIDAELWCFFHLRLNIRLRKQSRGRWVETPLRSLWRHCNGQ